MFENLSLTAESQQQLAQRQGHEDRTLTKTLYDQDSQTPESIRQSGYRGSGSIHDKEREQSRQSQAGTDKVQLGFLTSLKDSQVTQQR